MAQQLLQQSGIGHGGVLLITDGIDGDEPRELKAAIRNLVDAGHRLSVLGVGTTEGAPIATPSGGFLKDRNGAIVLPRLDDASLEALARQGNGSYRRISTDDSDFHALLAPFRDMRDRLQSKKAENINSDQWRDEGPWLLLPLLLLGMLAFRRGYVLVLLLLVLPLPHPAYAFDWNSLWQRDDQRAQQAMQAGDTKQAAELFRNAEWRAAANYRAGNYQAAAEGLQHLDSADAAYNRGNALAKQGKLQEAMSAYDEALKRDPKNGDAQFNRELVEKLLKQQDQQQQGNGNVQQGEGKDQQNKPDDKNGQSKSGQSKPGQSGSDQISGQQDSKTAQQADAQQHGAQQQDAGKNGAEKTDKDANKAEPEGVNKKDGQPDNNEQMANAQKNSGDDNGKPGSSIEAQQDASQLQQADKQWLQRIPDDPGGLWRRKFLYQYKQQQQSGKSEDKTW
jgi:Ca-activated chloride channel homolog